MKLKSVNSTEHADEILMEPVSKKGAYPQDGKDEDNTFATFTPSGMCELLVTNPDLMGTFKPGQVYYVDFTPAD